MPDADKEFFLKAAREVASGDVDQALYIKACALSNGDERKGRSLYIRLRADELAKESKTQRRLDTAVGIVAGAAGLTVGAVDTIAFVEQRTSVLRRTVCALSSLIIPGSGQALTGRFDPGWRFFILWCASWAIVLHFIYIAEAGREHEIGGVELIIIVVGGYLGALVVWPILAAIDAFKGYQRSS